MMQFDPEHRLEPYTIILSRRNHRHIGQLKNVVDIVSKMNMNAANEISFTVYKYGGSSEEVEPLWDEITDFKYVWVKELNEFYEIKVDASEGSNVCKNITGISACEAELSQVYIYGLEVNTELDIARKEYVNPTVFYKPENPKESLLHRALYKMPHYSIKHVDDSLKNIQRTFSADGKDIYSFLTGEVAEEIKCLFLFGSMDRSISVYDLQTVCAKCGKRGEFHDVCPECGSTDLKYYGDDTTIYVDRENLAENIEFTTDTDSVKNCFKLEAGDENMTAAVRNCNPNGSDYIYYFSEDQKHDMSPELVQKLNDYDNLYDSYRAEYAQVMLNMYNYLDKIAYYTSSMMPTREDFVSDAKKEAAKLTVENLSPTGLTEVSRNTSTATANGALRTHARVYVKQGYFKVDVNEGNFVYVGKDSQGHEYGNWTGNFKVTNYSDEEDTAISNTITVKVYDDYKTYLEQKIAKKLVSYKDDDGTIFDVLGIKDLALFKEALTHYCLNRLISFHDAIQGVIDIMIEEGQANPESLLYASLFTPYREKLNACQLEMDKRSKTIEDYKTKLAATQKRQSEIQKILDFESYIGTELFNEFCCYRREDKYSNDNYISDGFENDEIFKRAKEFIEVATEELVKSGEHQHSISATLYNLLAMKEFEPLKHNFKLGNFIRVRYGKGIYRLRLVSYQIDFNSLNNIDVEFSDLTKAKNFASDLNNILTQANSMATSYDYMKHQVQVSKEKTDTVDSWLKDGLQTSNVKIVNDAQNQNVVWGDYGLLARRKDDITEEYDDCQLKIINNGLYTTSDGWKTIDTAVGKSYYTDPVTGEQKVLFGIQAKKLVGELVASDQLSITTPDGSFIIDGNGASIRMKNVAGLEDKLTDYNHRINGAEQSANTSLDTAQNTQAELVTTKSELQGEINTTRSMFSDYSTTVEMNDAIQTATIVYVPKETYEKLVARVTALENQVVELNKVTPRVTALENQVTALERRVSALETPATTQ